MVVVEEERELLMLHGAGMQTDSDYEDIDEHDGTTGAVGTASGWVSTMSSTMSSRVRAMFTGSSLSRSFSRIYSVVSSAIWIVTTSLILVGLPVLYAYDREQNAVAMEREQQRFEAK